MGAGGSIVVGLALVGTVIVVLSLVRNPILRRISVRNVTRRKWSTFLVVAGSMVGTALIAGSLVINDTAHRLTLDLAYRHLGEIDQVDTLPASDGARLTYFDRQAERERLSLERLNAVTEASHGKRLVDGVLPVIHE